MPLKPALCACVLAAVTLPCLAAENEAPNDPSTPAVSAPAPSNHTGFTRWFTGRSEKSEERPEARVEKTDATADAEAPPPAFAPSAAARASDLVVSALGLLGISYRLGGSTPASGFDCSGMVRYVFQNALGLSLPHRAEEISRIGTKVGRDQLKPGDLVFYKTLRRAFSHVGIYLGNNRFIHAPSAGGAVRVDDMTEGYWATRFTGARRIDS